MRSSLALIFGLLLTNSFHSSGARAIEEDALENGGVSMEDEETRPMYTQRLSGGDNSGNSQIQTILNFLNEGEKEVKVAAQKDVVMILGNTGSGKSTLTQFLAGYDDQLISKEVGEDTGEYIIEDLHDRISKNSTISSKTIFPELILDAHTKIPYYDCPGFSDTRSAAHDIAATYFIKKVLDNSDTVKLVFSISYPAVRQGVDRQNFMLLVKHAVNLIKDVEKYKSSISLIVTKVDNQYIQRGQEFQLVPDKKIIEQIANFVSGVKQELYEKSNTATIANEDRDFYKKATAFTEELLVKEGDEYLRLAIFRRPNDAGPLSKIQLLQDGKLTMKKILDVNTNYVARGLEDFGYTISAESKNYVQDLTQEIIREIIFDAAIVGNEIQQYYNGQEKQIRDMYVLYDKFKLGHSTFLSTKTSSEFFEPQVFIGGIIKALKSLDIRLSKKNFTKILNYDSYLQFLTTVSRHTSTSQMPWPKGLTDLIDYLNLSEKWYNFLINFYTVLSEYDVQRDRTRFDTLNLKQQISLEANQGIRVDQTDLEKLLNKANEKGYKTGYSDINSLVLDKWKADMLKSILNLTLDYHVSSTCATSNKVVVKGQYVKLSEIPKLSCAEEIKLIEIYALNKIFIDADFIKTGSRVQLSIIAPTWHIVNNPKIILDGTPAEVHKDSKAPDGGASGSNGQDGKPGHNGGSAGNFLGIGENFINAQTLTLSANGGKGSDGQHGGNGKGGADGESPPQGGKLSQWESDGFKPSCEARYSPSRTGGPPMTCTLYGKAGEAGGNGGNGGIAGIGGPAGNITIIGLATDAGVTFSSKRGDDGKAGNGGTAGSGGKKGKVLVVNAVYSMFTGYVFGGTLEETDPNVYAAAGKAGSSNVNKNGQDNPESPIKFLNPALSINGFKNFLRENLYNSIRQSSLMNYLTLTEDNQKVLALYDTLGLVDELNGLENQYHKLHTQLSFLPLYKSLLNRISLYADNPKSQEKNTEYKSVLSHSYTATLSKICGINNDLENNLVIDTKTYLDLVISNINKLKEQSNKVAINEYYKGYEKTITKRTTEAQHFVDSEVSPAIDKAFNNLDQKIEQLIEKTIKMQNNTKEEKAKAMKEEMELQNSLVLRKLLGGVKIASQFLSFAGPVGTAVGGAVGGGIMVTESLLLDDLSSQGNDRILSLPAGIKNSLTKMSDQIKNKQVLLKEQLYDVNKEIEKLTEDEQSDNIKTIKQKVAEKRAELDKEIAKGAELDPASLDKLSTMRKELQETIKTQKTLIEKEKSKAEVKVEKQLRVVGYIQSVVSIGEMSVDLYSRIRNHEAKIKKAADKIAAANKRLEELDLFEKSIYNSIIPSCKNIEGTVKGVEKSLRGKTHVALDIENWKIQGTLKDMKLQIQQMTKNFDLEEDFKRCFEVLQEGMSVMITIYDRIQDYYDKAQLAAYIGNVNSANALNLKISDKDLKEAVDNLNLIIKSNLVLGQYEKAMTALTQYVFPFARIYLEEYSLPANLEIKDDINTLIVRAANQIEEIKTKLIQNKVLITKYDKYVHKKIDFDGESKQTPAFLTWSYNDHKETISKLLEGQKVPLKADIIKGIDKNAIKFNIVGISFTSSNETLQNELNNDLQDFELTMTHLGNSYYRCGNKFYVIPSEEQAIKYKLKKKANGDPIDTNDVYMKIKDNDYLLSPFTLWNLKLNNITAPLAVLQKYQNSPINLNLIGHGSYISKGIDVCNNDLDRYYKLDTTSEINEITLIDAGNLK